MISLSKRKRPSGDDKSGQNDSAAWMVTFADLIMLLLTFFVMLLSMKAMDRKDTREMFDKYIESDGVENQGGYHEEHLTPDSAAQGARKRALYIVSNAMLKKLLRNDYENFRRFFEVREDERGLILAVDSESLFEPGSAELKVQARPILDLAGAVFRKSSNDVLVAGHTDDRPTAGARYPSNWELSAYRALSVRNYLVRTSGVEPSRLAPGGYGDTRPLVPNDSDENRAKNRRVEFIIRK